VRAVIAALFICIALPAQAELVEQSRWLMGTELRIVLEAGDRSDDIVESMFRECFETVARCESVLSRFDPTAELARLNASAGHEVEVSAELFAWIGRCALDSRRTRGAFDPSVGTWILDPRSKLEVGMEKVMRDASRQAVFLPEGMALDSGGDGKGVAVDLIVARLKQEGYRGLVSFGGSSSYGLGKGPEHDGWPLAVMDVKGRWIGTVILRDAALSISHSLLVEQLGDGRTKSRQHIYDPETGELIRRERTAIVRSPSATDAEVLSTALIVRGARGMDFVDQFPGSEALLTPLPGHLPDWWEAPSQRD